MSTEPNHLIMKQESRSRFPTGLKPTFFAAPHGSVEAEPLQTWFYEMDSQCWWASLAPVSAFAGRVENLYIVVVAYR
jgi:hypothetical protein